MMALVRWWHADIAQEWPQSDAMAKLIGADHRVSIERPQHEFFTIFAQLQMIMDAVVKAAGIGVTIIAGNQCFEMDQKRRPWLRAFNPDRPCQRMSPQDLVFDFGMALAR